MALLLSGHNIDFNPEIQDGLKSDRGTSMIHEIAILCTCRNGDIYSSLDKNGKLTQRLASCPRCAGEMWLYRDPQLLVGFVTGIRGSINAIAEGIDVSGDMAFGTGMPRGKGSDREPRQLTLFDKLTATWSQPVDGGQVIVRAAGSKGVGSQFTTLEADEDKLWYEPDFANWCEDENGVIYKQNADFTLGHGRVIKWVGNKPKDGVKYVIKYNAYFEWIIFQSPQERVDRNGLDLGQSVYLRKKHIAFVNDSPNGNDQVKQSIQSTLRCQ